jgi:glycyl-tRNA synthetase
VKAQDVDAFNDPIDNKDSKRRYRADVLIEDYAEKLIKAIKEIEKAKFVWRCFLEQEFVTTNARVWNIKLEREILESLAFLGNEDLEDVKHLKN